MIVYLFGQPGSGKTTIANIIADELYPWTQSHKCTLIDGDRLREVFHDKDYSKAGRVRNVQRAMDIALWEKRHKQMVICSLVTPYHFQRIWLQQQLPENKILFVYLTYDEAHPRGREKFHVKDFEPPTSGINVITVDTSKYDPFQTAGGIIETIHSLK